MLSIDLIITFSKEGHFVPLTLKGLNLLKEKSNLKISNVIAVLDSPDQTTESYIPEISNIANKVIFTNFNNPAESRNAGLKISSSDYVTILDGDDYYSFNWIEKCGEYFNKVEPNNSILHPQFIISFGKLFEVYQQIGQNEDSFPYQMLLERNPYAIPSFGPRKAYLEIPFELNLKKTCFGLEDWKWNLDTMSAGYIHRVVEDTYYFYRRKLFSSVLESDISGSKYFDSTSWFKNPRLLSEGLKKNDTVSALKEHDFTVSLEYLSFVENLKDHDLSIKYLKSLSLSDFEFYQYKNSNAAKVYCDFFSLFNGYQNWIFCEESQVKFNLDNYIIVTSKYVSCGDKITNIENLYSSLNDEQIGLVILRLIIEIKPQNILVGDSNMFWALLVKHIQKVVSSSKLNLINRDLLSPANANTYQSLINYFQEVK